MDQNLYLEKVYGGLLGKCIGVRLGAPVEPTIWTYERIKETYGEITDYVKDYKNFAADDDVNGPLFFIRTLIDHPGIVKAKNVGRAWLNYTREGIGFYWWGGYGRSTEHTAYLNLKKGIQAPASGSIQVNGPTIAEQIGGQIFIDSWGWVFPNDCEKAATNAGIAASVGHDRNGIYGAKFIAACISLAFGSKDIDKIIDIALKQIPSDSEYARVVVAVRDFHQASPENWRDAREFLEQNFGYDRYGGVCHIIPNAGVCALALYYGGGNFARSVEIATMCGWDTDCNAGNVGAILGVLNGPLGIPDHYRRPINDWHAASSISGALNNISLPTASIELATLGLKELNETIPNDWKNSCFTDDIILDFSLPGSTAGLRSSSNKAIIRPDDNLNNSKKMNILIDRLIRGEEANIYYKPYYSRQDFDDERYRPSFTPKAFPGQEMIVSGYIETMIGKQISAAPYVRDAKTKKVQQGGFVKLYDKKDFSIKWTLPTVPFAIDEAGIVITNFEPDKYLGKVIISEYKIIGKRSFNLNLVDEKREFDGLSRCSAVGGYWEMEDGALHVITDDCFQLYTGPYYTTDSKISVNLIPDNGESHLVAFRARGAEYGYFFGLHGNNMLKLLKKDGDIRVLAQKEFCWFPGKSYKLSVITKSIPNGCRIICKIDDKTIIDFEDNKPHLYGMAGLAKMGAGRTHFINLSVEETA